MNETSSTASNIHECEIYNYHISFFINKYSYLFIERIKLRLDLRLNHISQKRKYERFLTLPIIFLSKLSTVLFTTAILSSLLIELALNVSSHALPGLKFGPDIASFSSDSSSLACSSYSASVVI